MSYYVYGSNISYQDYLQAKTFAQDVASASREAGQRISMEISEQTCQLIASNETLALENVRAMKAVGEHVSESVSGGFTRLSSDLEKVSDTMEEGFARLSYELEGIQTGISDLNAKFHWGFSQLIAGMGRMNDALFELIKIAKTPAQTAAYEQYETARNAFRQRLYAECLEALELAIAGDHVSRGYKLEWRFYQMKGTILIGFVGGDPALIDHSKAEEAFLLAARYAKTDYPEHAAQALLSAGWAAYCQGRMKEALAHTEQACSVDPAQGEAFFQEAKVLMAMGRDDAAWPFLAKAIELDRFYALKAAGDGDFQRYDDKLRDFLKALNQAKYHQIITMLQPTTEHLRIARQQFPDVGQTEIVRRVEAFVKEGAGWPLWDTLVFAHNLKRETGNLMATVPLIVRIQGADISCLRQETYQEEEVYPVEEAYSEMVVIRPKSLFRKAVTESQTKTRTIMKTRVVTKTRTKTEVISGKIFELVFSFVPAGSFLMGQGQTSHRVTISKDFYLGKFPITTFQWEAIMGRNPSHFGAVKDRPVETVSWNDYQLFIKKLNEMVGSILYRLPTEAEWEYACRAGSGGDFHFAESADARLIYDYVWYSANAVEAPHTVGNRNPNSWGLHDMHGNVWEWCQDWFEDDVSQSVTDPSGPLLGSSKVVRGGSWKNDAEQCHSAYRSSRKPDSCSSDVGFRLLRAVG